MIDATRKALMDAAEVSAREHPVLMRESLQQGIRRYRARIAVAYIVVAAVTVLVLAALLTTPPAVATLLGGSPTSGSTSTVTPSTPVAVTKITLTPASLTMAIDEERALSATATYSDGSIKSVTGAVWTSSDPDVATVSNSGTVTARAAGNASIVAEAGEAKASVPVTVTALTLASISLAPATETLEPGESVQLEAEGTYSDGNSHTLSSEVSWTSSAPMIASVDSAGKVTAHAPGAATITAVGGAHRGTARVNVVAPAVLVGIVLEPRNVTLEPKQTHQLTLLGNYSDGTSRPLAAVTTWTSSNTKVAQVDENGLTSAIEAGDEAVITASARGFKATATIAVIAPRPTSIIIKSNDVSFSDDAHATMASASTGHLYADGVFAGGKSQPLEGVTWTSSNPDAASIDPVSGVVTTTEFGGTTQITATWQGVEGRATIVVEVSEPIIE